MTRLVSLLLAGVFCAPLVVVAHEGHDHKTMGTVSVIHENHLEVKAQDGKTMTFTIAPATRLRRAKAIVKLDAIKTGERVVVTWREVKDKAGKVTVTVREVQLGVAATPTRK